MSLGGGGSTLRPAHAAKAKGTRLSILFDPTRNNPFSPEPEAVVIAPEEVELPLSPSPLTSAEAEDEGGQAEQSEGSEEEDDELKLDLTGPALAAISTHAFEGEAAFGELSFGSGWELVIEVEDLGGNWALGYVKEEGEKGRGLIPKGWFKVSVHSSAAFCRAVG